MASEINRSNQDPSQEPSLKAKTAKGLFWGGISNGMQQLMQVVFGLIMMRLLVPEDYGVVAVLLIFPAIAMAIQESGFTTAIINKKNIQHKDYNAVFWFSVLSSLMMYMILFFTAPFIADFYNIPILKSVSRVLFLNFLVGGFGVAHYAYLVKNLMVKDKAKIEIFALFISGVIGVILAFGGFAYWAIVIQQVSYFTFTVIIRWFLTPWKPTLEINFRPLQTMYAFSFKLLLSSIISRVAEHILSILFGKYYNKQMAGYYAQGSKWSIMGGSFLSGMIGNVALPILTQINENRERQKNVFRKMLRFGAFVSFPLLLGLAFVGKEFLLIVGNGDKWLPAVPFLQLFCIWNSVVYIYTLYTNLLLTHHKSDIIVIGTALTGALQLLIVIIMFKFGIFQMVIAFVGINFAGLLFWHYFTNKIIGLKIVEVLKDISPYLITAIGSVFVAFFVTKSINSLYLRFILKIVITSILYLFIMWKSNSVIVRESFAFFRKSADKRITRE